MTETRRELRHGDEVREGAYEVWVSCGRNATETGGLLGVPARTVQYWCKADRWRQRHAVELFPVERHEAYGMIRDNLIAAGIYASEQLLAHHNPDDAFRFTDKVDLDAAHGAVDRVGFSPVRVLTAPSIDEAPATRGDLTPDDLARLSPADLRALEQGRSVSVPATLRDREAVEVSGRSA